MNWLGARIVVVVWQHSEEPVVVEEMDVFRLLLILPRFWKEMRPHQETTSEV
jgi:hypothetical protein